LFDLSGLGRTLMLFGVILVVAGAFLTFGGRLLGLGRLPGDILIRRGGFTLYFPIVTCIVLSLVLTLVVNLIFRR